MLVESLLQVLLAASDKHPVGNIHPDMPNAVLDHLKTFLAHQEAACPLVSRFSKHHPSSHSLFRVFRPSSRNRWAFGLFHRSAFLKAFPILIPAAHAGRSCAAGLSPPSPSSRPTRMSWSVAASTGTPGLYGALAASISFCNSCFLMSYINIVNLSPQSKHYFIKRKQKFSVIQNKRSSDLRAVCAQHAHQLRDYGTGRDGTGRLCL